MSEDREDTEAVRFSGDEENLETDAEAEEAPTDSDDADSWTWVSPDDGSTDSEPSTPSRMWQQFEEPDQESDANAESPTDSTPEQDDTEPQAPPRPPIPDDRPQTTPSSPSGIRNAQPLYRAKTVEFYVIWFLAALTFGAGDLISTGAVLSTPFFGEANPVVRLILTRFGYWGFVGLKLAVFAVLLPIGVYGGINRNKLTYYGPPLVAMLFGSGLTLWNLTKIMGG